MREAVLQQPILPILNSQLDKKLALLAEKETGGGSLD
jgi:hypothetical protein